MTQPKSTTYSMQPTAATTHHEIVLKYDWNNRTMKLSDNGVDHPDRTFHLQVGDELEFSSPNGAVDIELQPPEVFQPNTFTGGKVPSPPVKVIAQPATGVSCKLWCGIQDIVSASAHIPAYGGDPMIP